VDAPEHIGFAAQAINLLGQQATVPLNPRVTDLQSAVPSQTGLLVVATGDQLAQAQLKAPVLPEGPGSVDINGTTATDVDLRGPLGVIQAFAHNDRMVLAVSGTGDWALTNDSFDYIRGMDARWASLSGDTVATGAAGQTLSLTIREGTGMVDEYPGDGWKWWAWASIGVGVAVLACAAGVLFVRLWRRRRAPV